MNTRFTSPLLLFVMSAAFALGWRMPSASTPGGLDSPINMTFADHTLYVSDQLSGVHIYDVADPALPRAIAQIPLTNHRGTAVKNDVLYASTFNSLRVYRREADTFTFVTELESEYDYYEGGWNEGVDEGYSFACACRTGSFVDEEAPAPHGSSSYATFAAVGDYLYRVDHRRLITYDISDPAKPKEVSRSTFGFTIETLYPTAEHLFIGGSRGMYVCNRSNPAKPAMIGEVQHVRACDPVVVSGRTAYVTVRGGTTCGQSDDLLLTVDIADPSNPSIVSERNVATPFGLVVRDTYLYVSTGQNGYSLYNITNPALPSPLKSWADWPTRDFVWSSNVLYVLGVDDVRVFDVTDPKTPVLLAVIESDPS